MCVLRETPPCKMAAAQQTGGHASVRLAEGTASYNPLDVGLGLCLCVFGPAVSCSVLQQCQVRGERVRRGTGAESTSGEKSIYTLWVINAQSWRKEVSSPSLLLLVWPLLQVLGVTLCSASQGQR